MTSRFDLIVIGGGPAGVVAALRARELGATVALVERGKLGGSCINDGCIPMRGLAKAARLVRDAAQCSDYGLHIEQPVVDFRCLLEQVQQIVSTVHASKQLAENLEQAGVCLFTEVGAARFIDDYHIALADGQTLHATKFIICAGGSARNLIFPGSHHALTANEIWRLPRLPSEVAVVGGAATGCQIASVLAAFGTQVWLLESNAQLLRGCDELIATEISAAFQQRGIAVVTGVNGIGGIEQVNEQLHFSYTQHGQHHTLAVEAVILAVGWPGNIEALNLKAAGVRTERGYIVVDDWMRSSAPHIYAAGDITGRTMLVQSADQQGRIAAENAILGRHNSFAELIVPFGGFTDPEYAGVGLSEQAAHAAYNCAVAVVPYTDLDRAVIDGRTKGSFKLIVEQETRRILGAHVVGEQAVEVVQIVAASMAAEMPVEVLADLKLAYPTFTAIVGVAARRLVRMLGVVPLALHWRDLHQPRVADWERSLVQ